MSYDAKQVEELNKEFSGKSPEDALKWALDNVHPNIALASSFGAEDVVVIDMLMKVSPEARVFTLDTGRLNQETYNVMDDVKNKYNLTFSINLESWVLASYIFTCAIEQSVYIIYSLSAKLN